MSKSLKSELKDHYQSAKLSEKQLARLSSLQKLNHQDKMAKVEPITKLSHAMPFSKRMLPSWALACCFLLAILSFYLFQWRTEESWPKADAIAAEVVYNHLKQRPLDFVESDFRKLNQSFVQLDFNLQKSGASGQFYLWRRPLLFPVEHSGGSNSQR